jgi:hypothetical protein
MAPHTAAMPALPTSWRERYSDSLMTGSKACTAGQFCRAVQRGFGKGRMSVQGEWGGTSGEIRVCRLYEELRWLKDQLWCW